MAAPKTIAYMGSVPVDAVAAPLLNATASLHNIKTLLKVISEMADYADLDAGKPGRDTEWAKGKFQQITQLAWIAIEEQERTLAYVDAGESAAMMGVDYRLVA